LKFIQYAYTGCVVLLVSFMLYVTFFDFRRLPLFKALLQRGSQVVDSAGSAPAPQPVTNAPAPVPTPSR
jgi:hypothetical protein